ncbi:ABC transporter substrate-binding protein [Dactylosporangium sp. NPDC000555]|uniref:ABC transporter substrate-binding protein n=1 Tax=Dactylosporangium sp. NPDC000555 TaxID=3154260 RepID=UPI0033213897
MTTARRSRLACAAALLVLVASGCGDGAVSRDANTGGAGGSDATAYLTKTCNRYQPTVGVTDTSIKVGYSGALGGPFATVGVALWGMLGYFDMINAKGGVRGADGKQRKIEVVYKDDQYQVATTKANVQKLVDDDKVFALLGIVGSSANQAIRPIVNQGCVPNMFATAGAPELGDPSYPWAINGPVAVYHGEGLTYANYLKQHMPQATVAFMSQHDDYGRAEIGSFKDGIAGSQVKIVKEVTFETTDADLSGQITTLAATKADVVIVIALGAQMLQSINTISAHPEWKPQVLTAPISVSQLSHLNPGAGHGLLTGTSIDVDDPKLAGDPKVALFRKWVEPVFQKNNVKLPVSAGVGGWNEAALFVQTVEKATAVTRADVMAVARNFKPDRHDIIFMDGLTLETGPDDPYLVEGMVISKWDANTKTLSIVDTIDLNGQVKFKSYQ